MKLIRERSAIVAEQARPPVQSSRPAPNCRPTAYGTRRRCSPAPSTHKKDRRTIARKVRINEDIRANMVRVVDPSGEHHVVYIDEALKRARAHKMDLVEIAPSADPPVCKIVDYGKFRYEQQKKGKEQRKKSQTIQLKEVRFRPHTDTHDFEFKTRHARNFLQSGNKVKAWVQFRGRDIIYKEQGMDLLRRFTEDLQDVARIDQPPRMEGRRMTTILAPDKK